MLIKTGGATDVLHYLQKQGSHVDSCNYVKLLQRCIEVRDLVAGRHVHGPHDSEWSTTRPFHMQHSCQYVHTRQGYSGCSRD
jgi:hypothetical protein